MDHLNEDIQNNEVESSSEREIRQNVRDLTNNIQSSADHLPFGTLLNNGSNTEVSDTSNLSAEQNINQCTALELYTADGANTSNNCDMDNTAAVSQLPQPISEELTELTYNSNHVALLRDSSDFDMNSSSRQDTHQTDQSSSNYDLSSDSNPENRGMDDTELLPSSSPFGSPLSPLVPQPVEAGYGEAERFMESDEVTSELSETYNADMDGSDNNDQVEIIDQLMAEENSDQERDTGRASSPDQGAILRIGNDNGNGNDDAIGASSGDYRLSGLAAIEERLIPNIASSSLHPRDSFMQRFRRILFILSNRRRRLIRLGLIAPESDETEENPRETLEHLAQSLGAPLEIDDLEDLRPRGPRPEENVPEDAVRFDTNLPAEHAYMGSNMNRVSGVNYLEAGQQHNLMLFMHQEILFPGEILPFMISGSVIDGSTTAQGQDGFLFGVCFPFINDKKNPTYLYGITCQIYEKGSDNRGNTFIKSRALQRFVIKSKELIGTLEYINDHPTVRCYSQVEILPDIYLPDPLGSINMGSMSRFRDSKGVRDVYRRYQVATTPWPLPVYDYYSISSIVEKARTQLAQHKIDTMPTDPTQLSYWLVQNLHLSESQIHTIFLTNCVNKRLKIIASTFKAEAVFSCRFCTNNIASCRELFAMSKHGVQTQYCNSAGFIHKTNTVYHVNTKAIIYSGTPSSEFSWFPGYQWQIILCKVCKHHMGWEYKAEDANLVPKLFYGISSSSVRICSTQVVGDEDRVRSSLQLNSIRALFNSHWNPYRVPIGDIEVNSDDSSDSL